VTRRRHAFTLVELLVVIVIIGVLMALLFPAILNALKSAGEAQCQGNLGQLAKVIQTYCSDYHGQFPLRATTRTPASANNWLFVVETSGKDFTAGLLMANKYIGDEEILYCPLDKERGLARPSGALMRQLPSNEEVAPTSYVINGSITWGDYDWGTGESRTRVRGRNIGDFDATDFLFIEQSAGVDPEPSSRFDEAYMIPDSGRYRLTARHRDGGFVSCMGGSVERYTSEKFKEAMDTIGGAANWFNKKPKRPTSTPDNILSDEEIGSRWNPG